MKSIARLSSLIELEVAKINWPSKPANLYEPLAYFMQLGGKRMRPVLTLMAAEMFDKNADAALPTAMGVELFHNFTLIHDDIMDEAPLRRAQETVHHKWNNNIAILSGDVLMVLAYQYICKQEPKHLPDLMELFNRTAVEVCEGQQMDMDFESRKDVSIEEYIEMIRLKTSVLLGCALEMGAIVADATAENRKNIYAFGQDLGLAFQIKDDILDLYGDPEKFGKQIGGDVIANKKTLLYLLALENANAAQKETFKQLESEIDLDFKVKAVRKLFSDIGVQTLADGYMQKYFTQAMAALSDIDISVEKKQDLIQLADYLMNREH